MKLLGFTGTRFGMTDLQKQRVGLFLAENKPEEVCHGDCIGADADFHDLVREVLPECKIHIRPGPDGEFRAHKQGDVLHPEFTFLARNRHIVQWCDALIGCPKEMLHQTHGGTWYTLDYAKKVGKPFHIIYPVVPSQWSENATQ